MAGIARVREALGQMVGIGGFLKLRHVARRAIRQHAVLPSDDGFVAPLTLHGSVGANQRKKIHVVADLLLGSEPALHHMALRAIRAKLAQMNIGMAIGTVFADVGENRLGVTLRAGKPRVPAPKRKFSLIVIKFQNGADRMPACSRVTIFAGNG
jgi:hypothetical protein